MLEYSWLGKLQAVTCCLKATVCETTSSQSARVLSSLHDFNTSRTCRALVTSRIQPLPSVSRQRDVHGQLSEASYVKSITSGKAN